VRALADPDAGSVSLMAVPRTVVELRTTAPPTTLTADTPRLPRVERSTFQLQVAVIEVATLDSGALALTVADPDDGAQTAVVELPDPDCAATAASPRAADIAAARASMLSICGV